MFLYLDTTMNKDFLPIGSRVDNGGSKKMRSATDSSTLTRILRETATFHPYAEGGAQGMYLPKRGRWNSYADATPWMNGVRNGNLFLGAYDSSRNAERAAYTSDIPEPPKVVLPVPIYLVYYLGSVLSSNPATLTILGGGTVWTYTVATNSVRSIAGSGTNTSHETNIDGQGMNARFSGLGFIQASQDGTLYVAARIWGIIRRISSSGYVEKYVGTGETASYVPGTSIESASLYYPTALHLDQTTGSLYIGNHMQIVIVTKSREISAISVEASNYRFAFGQFSLDSSKNIIAADPDRHVIFKVTPSGVVTVIAGGDEISGYTDSSIATNARFNKPIAVIVDSQDNIIVYDSENYRFRKITPAGVVTTIAGNGTGGQTDGTGSAATFNIPSGHPLQLQIDPSNTVWIPYGRIRKMTPAGVVSTVYAI